MQGYALSHKGLVRKSNQDAFIFLSDIKLLAVADGMGGHRGGDIASTQAVKILEEYVRQHEGLPEVILHEAFNEANYQIFSQSKIDANLQGMGTTLTAAILREGRLIIAHVGDSRAYLYQENTFTQLTDDHSFVGELMRHGNITSQEADKHPNKNMLTRALGSEETVDVEIRVFEVEKGSKILLSSDGLSNMLNMEEIKAIINGHEPVDAVEVLIAKALDRGGIDNITAVLGIVEGEA